MKRHYFVSDDLDDLESMEEELERAGIPTTQIHVLTLDDAAAETHERLHDVQSLMKKDVIHSGEYGLVVGAVAAASVLMLTYMAGWHTSPVGWIPFIFLAIVLLGFFTWEGGFIGIQTFNVNFQRFKNELEQGRHLFFVDLEDGQEDVLDRVVRGHPGAQRAGTGRPTPHWIVTWQQRLKRLLTETLP
ncbi:MAG: hypothetical protein ACODAC_01620 [Pseudomonadota bacterium]